MLLTKTVKVKWNEKTRKHYEDLGYKYTKTGDEFEVKVEDLTKGCNAIISYNCDNCGEVKECMYKDYVKIKKINGYNYYCNKCRHNHRSNSKKEKDTKKIKKSSLYDWCIKNDRLDVLERWDYELNDCSPKDISWCSNDRYYFKCDKYINHHSELKSIWGSITQRNGEVICNQCNSVAQYILDNFPDKDLYDVWDNDKNGDLDPWSISKGSNKKIWIICQEKDYHGSYNCVPNNFTNGSRCTYCSNKKVHPKDSLGQYIIDNYNEEFLSIWSNKNKKSPFEYSTGSTQKVWWRSIDNTCEDFERKIYSSVKYNFSNPKVINRLKPNYETTLTEEQIIKGFNIGDNYRAYVKDCISKTLGYYKRECTGIYKIENSINGKVYIGQAKNIEDRWVEHVYSSLSKSAEEYNYPLYHAFRKYGIGNFNFDIIEECKIEEIDEREIYYIKQYNSNIHNKNSHGYNQTDGGNAIRGWKMSEEQKQRQRDIIQEKRKNGVYDFLNKTVICEDREFESAKKCAEYYEVNYLTMVNWLNHNNNMPKKWYNKGLRYKNEPMSNYKLSEVEIRRVICEGIIYDNITECAKYYGVKPRLLSRYLNKYNNMPELWFERELHFEGENMEDYTKHYDYKLGNHPCAKRVVCEDMIFECVKACAEYYGIKDGTITRWLNHNNNMPQEWFDKGLHYENESMDSYIVQKKDKKGKNNYNSKSVICNDKEFDCLTECAEYYGEKVENMVRWLNKSRNMPQKFYDMKLHYKGTIFEECNYKIAKPSKRVVICDNIEFSSVSKCAEYYKVSARTMSCWLNGNNNIPQEWYDRGLHYKGESMSKYNISTKNIQIICENKLFNSITECAEYYGINSSTMQYWLKGKHKMPKDFKDKGLKYYNDK